MEWRRNNHRWAADSATWCIVSVKLLVRPQQFVAIHVRAMTSGLKEFVTVRKTLTVRLVLQQGSTATGVFQTKRGSAGSWSCWMMPESNGGGCVTVIFW